MLRASQRPQFPGLNALRAIGAFIVIPAHIEQLKASFDLPTLVWFRVNAKIGVDLFFTLSGFLITFLLLHERQARGRISISSFYVRRMLRIWPLYFLIVLSSLFVFSRIPALWSDERTEFLRDYKPLDIVFFFLILPNFAGAYLPYAGQIWSIGVEEQFYLLQPWLAQRCRSTGRVLIVLFVLCWLPELGPGVSRMFCNTLGLFGVDAVLFDRLDRIWVYFSCIAIGGVFGVVRFRARPQVLRLAFSKWTQIAAYLAIAYLLWRTRFVWEARFLRLRQFSLAFGIVLLNVSSNPHSLIKLRSSILDHLGKISYGLYMYHPICIGAVLLTVFMPFQGQMSPRLLHGLTTVSSFALTIVVAELSYRFFEGPFLRLKDRGRPS